MILTLDTERLRTLEEIRTFMEGNRPVDLRSAARQAPRRVSDDNPFSEARLKTLKCHPGFPGRFRDITAAIAFCRTFFPWYNTEHRHGGIAMLTPDDVHHRRARSVLDQRGRTLQAAWTRHPERFVRGVPQPDPLPEAVWINPPVTSTTGETAQWIAIGSVSKSLRGVPVRRHAGERVTGNPAARTAATVSMSVERPANGRAAPSRRRPERGNGRAFPGTLRVRRAPSATAGAFGRDVFLLRVEGDDMAPRVRHGEFVCADPAEPVEAGRLWRYGTTMAGRPSVRSRKRRAGGCCAHWTPTVRTAFWMSTWRS